MMVARIGRVYGLFRETNDHYAEHFKKIPNIGEQWAYVLGRGSAEGQGW